VLLGLHAQAQRHPEGTVTMRIHTSTLTESDIYAAARAARATVESLSQHRSRTHDHAFEVKLTGNSRRRPNGGSYGADRDAYAATWDQWGVFLGLLFDTDATMRTTYDKSKGDFGYRTDWRFSELDASDIQIPLNHDHTFRYAGIPRE